MPRAYDLYSILVLKVLPYLPADYVFLNLHFGTLDRRSCDRIKAVLACDEGYSYAEIAKILLLDDETARRFVNDYLTKDKLRIQNKGSESHLDADQTEKLVLHLEKKTYLHVKEICEFVLKTFAVAYTVSGMMVWTRPL